jgi:hypothetical protein
VPSRHTAIIPGSHESAEKPRRPRSRRFCNSNRQRALSWAKEAAPPRQTAAESLCLVRRVRIGARFFRADGRSRARPNGASASAASARHSPLPSSRTVDVRYPPIWTGLLATLRLTGERTDAGILRGRELATPGAVTAPQSDSDLLAVATPVRGTRGGRSGPRLTPSSAVRRAARPGRRSPHRWPGVLLSCRQAACRDLPQLVPAAEISWLAGAGSTGLRGDRC